MSMKINLTDDERAWVVPVLHELKQDGAVDRAKNWSELRKEMIRKLDRHGAGERAERLVRPMDVAVDGGAEFTVVVAELSALHPLPAADGATETLEFEAMLPAADELAQAIITDLGVELGRLIGSDPELAASLDGTMLVDWVTEDLASAIDQIAKSESAWLAGAEGNRR
jgi:hypothetical protein